MTRRVVSTDQPPLGSIRSGASGKAAAQCPQRLDLVVGIEDAGLQLQRAEAVLVEHPAGLADHLLVADALAPAIGG